ncbi:hypothetical protein BBI10_16785 [Pseudomonas graminis]|uniref:Uncharacterized protein n=1 Tax=Pseudomonas graminis TaxID=158627 RepID=A0A1C2DV64_9PSED|nr:hypothetical protein BBI10_16785 [Pseudomonas graminis]
MTGRGLLDGKSCAYPAGAWLVPRSAGYRQQEQQMYFFLIYRGSRDDDCVADRGTSHAPTQARQV